LVNLVGSGECVIDACILVSVALSFDDDTSVCQCGICIQKERKKKTKNNYFCCLVCNRSGICIKNSIKNEQINKRVFFLTDKNAVYIYIYIKRRMLTCVIDACAFDAHVAFETYVKKTNLESIY
jgi:hypothetical protein